MQFASTKCGAARGGQQHQHQHQHQHQRQKSFQMSGGNKWDIIRQSPSKNGENIRGEHTTQDLWPQMLGTTPPTLGTTKGPTKCNSPIKCWIYVYLLCSTEVELLGSQRIFMLWPMFILFELYVARCLHGFGVIRFSIDLMIMFLFASRFFFVFN